MQLVSNWLCMSQKRNIAVTTVFDLHVNNQPQPRVTATGPAPSQKGLEHAASPFEMTHRAMPVPQPLSQLLCHILHLVS
jgi:hypothetical protein